MLGIKVPKKEAEKIRKQLLELNLLDVNFRVKHQNDFVIFPIKERVTSSPRSRKGLPTWKLARLGVHPRASRSEVMHPSGRSQAPHPTPLFKEWATKYVYLAEYLNLSHPPPLAYPLPYGRSLASNKKIKGFEIIETTFEKAIKRPHSYREVVDISSELQSLLPSSFDIIGDIAIIELPEELMFHGKNIGKAILKVHKHIKAVFAKGSKVSGKYRVRELLHLAGEKRTETIHRENGIRLKLDVAKVYFSPRLATERTRVFSKSKEGEVVFDMFAGVGPYSILLAKKAKMVFACDINPRAIRYLEENKKLNKVENLIPILGDVRKVAGQIKADRVIMNLPKFAHEFLKEAMISVKNGGIIHYYGFSHEENLFGEHLEKIEKVAEELGKNVKVLEKRKVRPYAPYQFNIAIDFGVF